MYDNHRSFHGVFVIQPNEKIQSNGSNRPSGQWDNLNINSVNKFFFCIFGCIRLSGRNI